MKKTHSKKALTLIELLVSLTILGFIGLVIFSGFKYFHVSTKDNTWKTLLLQRTQESMAHFTKALTFTLGIDKTYLPSIVGYSNSTNSLCLALPSVDVNGFIVEDDGTPGYNDVALGTYKDYLYFSVNGSNQLTLETIVNPAANVPAEYTPSFRQNGTLIVAKNISGITFTTDGTKTLSTYISDGDDLDDLKAIYISVTAKVTTPMGRLLSKTLTTKFKFRNKP